MYLCVVLQCGMLISPLAFHHNYQQPKEKWKPNKRIDHVKQRPEGKNAPEAIKTQTEEDFTIPV